MRTAPCSKQQSSSWVWCFAALTMQDTVLRVFVVALGLFICPREDPSVVEYDETTTVGMQQHEEITGEKLDHQMAHTDNRGSQGDIPYVTKEDVSVLEYLTVLHRDGEGVQTAGSLKGPDRSQNQQEKHEQKEVFTSKEQESHCHTMTSENETSDAVADWEGYYLWFIWNTLSIISTICFLKKFLGQKSEMKPKETTACTAAEVLLPDSDTLYRFHSKCIKVSSDKKWKEFLEGFTNDLLDAMRNVCEENGGMVIDYFTQIVDVRNIIVPFTPPDPYRFHCQLLNNQASDPLTDMQVCGQIKLLENKEKQNGCHCQSPNADDVVCLLHCEVEKVKRKSTNIGDGLLCMNNSQFLSKRLVTRWFQSTIKQAWEQISHKYEFELNIRYFGAPGALMVCFRSGEKISFTMNPVVQVNTDAHFFITHCTQNNFDTAWKLSLTKYEDLFLDHFSNHLPVNSCHSKMLEIVCFLLKQQTALSGSSALKASHFKTALMHLLLAKNPTHWKPEFMACRLRDLLVFVERSLQKKLLHHVLIGNPLHQRVIELPPELTQAESMNLFHPLVVHGCSYKNAVTHFQEVLKNADLLIHDCV